MDELLDAVSIRCTGDHRVGGRGCREDRRDSDQRQRGSGWPDDGRGELGGDEVSTGIAVLF
jgi:hypothetical protein